MDKVTYKGQEYIVKYKHERVSHAPGQIEPRGGLTTAYIIVDETIPFEGHAKCHSKETYNKRIGRNVSLGRLRKLLAE